MEYLNLALIASAWLKKCQKSIDVSVKHLSLAKLQTLAFLVLVAVLCVKVIWEVNRLAILRSGLVTISEQAIPKFHLTDKLATQVSQSEDIVLGVFLGSELQDVQAEFAQLKDEIETSRSSLLAFQSKLPDDRQIKLIAELEMQYDQLDQATTEVFRLIQQDKMIIARQFFMERWEALHHALFFNLNLLSAYEMQNMQDLVSVTEARMQSVGLVSVILAVLGLLLSLLLAMIVIFWLQDPVKRILHLISRVMRGEPISESEFESNGNIDFLNHRFNELLAWLHGTFEDSCHELRTYITIIRGEANVALRKPPNDPEYYRESLVSIASAVEQMGQLVDDLVFLGRSQVGQMHYHIAPVAVDKLTQNVLKQCRRLAAMKQIDLQAEVPDSATVNGDFNRLCQVLIILLENAIKYTAAGGKVSLACTVTATHVEWRVTDTGIGIAVEDLPHIFRRFYRAAGRQPRSTSGTGLGLAIAQSIIQAHKGEIRVESTVGVGTEVTVLMPRLID